VDQQQRVTFLGFAPKMQAGDPAFLYISGLPHNLSISNQHDVPPTACSLGPYIYIPDVNAHDSSIPHVLLVR
jgi:hypothetical protein